MLITDSNGITLYSKSFDKIYKDFNFTLLSGLISAVESIGKELFNEDLASIYFGEKRDYNITIITKRFLNQKTSIFFIFLMKGEFKQTDLQNISTRIFIETKAILRHENSNIIGNKIAEKTDKILRNYL